MWGGNTGRPAAPVETPKREVCKYFLNGGCLRGDDCTFSHELPDDRHLDVNGVGFILNTNVAVANFPKNGAAPKNRTTPPARRMMPKYRPCLASVKHQLPPALSAAFETQPVEKDNLLSLLGAQRKGN